MVRDADGELRSLDAGVVVDVAYLSEVFSVAAEAVVVVGSGGA